jgi:type II secretory pathway pseudopilin PulG
MVQNSSKGFILIDSIIAIAIIVVVFAGVGGIVGMFIQARGNGAMANSNLTAYHLAQARLEELNRSNIAWGEITDTDDTAVDPIDMTKDTYNYPPDQTSLAYNIVRDLFLNQTNIDTSSASYKIEGRTETLPIKNSSQVFTRATRAFPVKIDSSQAIDYINPKNNNNNNKLIQVIVTVSWNENVGGKARTNKVTASTLHDIAQE